MEHPAREMIAQQRRSQIESAEWDVRYQEKEVGRAIEELKLRRERLEKLKGGIYGL